MVERERDYLRSPAAFTILKSTALGFALGQADYLLVCFYLNLADKVQPNTWQFYSAVVEGCALAGLVAIALARYWRPTLVRVLSSKRIDLLLSTLVGASVAVAFPSIGSSWYGPLFGGLTATQFVVVVAVPVILAVVLFAMSAVVAYPWTRRSRTSFFVSDAEKQNAAEDLLNFSGAAARFAERVLNGDSSESIVFGVDAPWGTGKSTFINFCAAHWSASGSAIVYRFNPLQYEDRRHLLSKFVDGLVMTLREHVFIPELRTIVSRYSSLISAKRSVSFAGIDFDLTPPSLTVEAAAAGVRDALSNLKRRLIIVVDDLDRMEFAALKDMLFVIRKGFVLPNVSFVLCYDTQNIAAFEGKSYNNEKISEFLEKFVNVKVGLYPSSEDLKKYVTENLKIALAGNLQTDFQLLDCALDGLRDIYDSADYFQYLPLVGDIRKVKRLINTLVLLDIDKADFVDTDLAPRDLTLLLLLYINYPTLFRLIYNAETNGRSGNFTAISRRTQANKEYENSDYFREQLAKLEAGGRHSEKLLLVQLFDVTTRLGGTTDASRVSEAVRSSLACFNSDDVGGRNLETYLNLIVRVAPPKKEKQYKFYANAKDKLKDGAPLWQVFADDVFSFDRSEETHDQFWRVLINSLEEFNSAAITAIIRYALSTFVDYSALDNSKLGIGLRNSKMPYTLLKLLDVGGWHDGRGLHRDNSDENVMEIADWIFGLGSHSGEGVLESLTDPARGVLGWHDVLRFRLYSCIDRGGALYNLQRALTHHSDPQAPVTGLTTGIVVFEMRRISQRIFQLFKSQYITSRRNLFREIDDLTLDALAGKFQLHVKKEVAVGGISQDELDQRVAECKTSMKGFNIYQLTNKLVSSGVGCGRYDEIGDKDQGGIFVAMNEYLFGVCFQVSEANDGYRYFVDYLLGGFEAVFDAPDGKWRRPRISSMTSVLDKQCLTEYWRTHSVGVRARSFELELTEVFTPNYRLRYSEGVPMLFDELDTLLTPSSVPDDSAA